MPEHLPLISVCVCTWHRRQQLHDLLLSIGRQRHSDFTFEVIVVDNDHSGSARSTVSSHIEANLDIKVAYVVEPRQGISFARNRAVALAKGSLLAFIDDDETAAPDWLEELLACQRATGADAVFGPVLPSFAVGSRRWAVKSGLFERPRHSHCARVTSRYARTGNALVNAKWCRQRTPTCFDEALAFTGGEDYEFFLWLEQRGGALVWSEKAIVREFVPIERQRIAHLLKRSLRTSLTYWRERNASRNRIAAGAEAVKGLAIGISCSILGILALAAGLHVSIRWWARGMAGLGRVWAFTCVEIVGYGDSRVSPRDGNR